MAVSIDWEGWGLERVEVGIPGFDSLALGGLPQGRTTLLAGGTGSGKTVFGLQFLASGVRELRALGATTLLAAERSGEKGYVARYGAEEFIVDNVVILRNDREGEYRRRTVEVLKLRGAEHGKGEFPFVINPKAGIEIVPFSII